MFKKIVNKILTFIFRVEIIGLDNYHQAGKRVLIIANHTSFLDPVLLWVFLPDDITFAINTQIADRWWLKPFLGLSHVFRMDPTHPLSLKELIHYLQQDIKTVIFPEGRITVTGSLMKVYDGPGMVADKANAKILPIRISGAEYTHFSKLHKIVRLRLFPKITLHILPAIDINAPQELHGKMRRHFSGQVLTHIMTEMMFVTSNYQQTVFTALLEARSIHGGSYRIIEDIARKRLSYNEVITRSIALGNELTKITGVGENVGIFLPNACATLCTILGLQYAGRVPAMLNFSTGSAGMISACKTAQVKTVLTSRTFIEKAALAEEAAQLSQRVQLIYLEDLAQNITLLDKVQAFVSSQWYRFYYQPIQGDPDTPAVVLFTSGSEGEPKGVVLSHSNIIANHKQVKAVINFNAQDVVLNFLPMFHSFGFSVGSLLPLLNGMQTFYYPTPLHFAVIPEMAYEVNATIMFGTNTFFAAYGKKAHPYDFFKLRYVVAGAEKLQENTKQLWLDKFGIRILEGYGATETAPVAAVNTPMANQAGSVGRLLPAMDYRLEPVDGIEDAGRLHLTGPNIMQGYLLPDNPGQLVPPASIYGPGWYDTGDIVKVDTEGFVSIQGRSKRFAKISGEMVSLTVVEQIATTAWPEAHHAAISLPDPKKGEQIILMTTHKGATVKELSDSAEGIATICLPRKILIVEQIPAFATGKTNYPAVTELVKEKLKN